MARRCFFFIFFRLFYLTASAQNDVPDFGKIDIADLQMKECPFDKSADALNLLNYEQAEFYSDNYGYYIDIERRMRIKIFKESGYRYASIVIPYLSNGGDSKITHIAAITYNLDANGNIVVKKLEKDDIFKDKSKKGVSSIRFAFPDVKPGTVVELKYTKKESFSLHLDSWLFQDVIPTRLSVCQLIYRPDVAINTHFLTSIAPEKYTDQAELNQSYNGKTTQTYLMRDIPAFRSEPMMTSLKDNLQRAEFSVLPTRGYFRGFFNNLPIENRWGVINFLLCFSPHFGQQLQRAIPGTETGIDSIKKLTDAREKINAVYQWVKTTVKWNKEEDYYGSNIDEIWGLKAGNSAEINLTIINLLRKTGIKCYPILVSTRDHGIPDMSFPNIGQFNSVDALVFDSSGSYILDGTQQFQSYKIPPYNILNRDAFLIDTAQSKWIHVEDKRPLLRDVINISAAIDSEGSLNGNAVMFYHDLSKVDVMTNTQEDNADRSKGFLDLWSKDIKIDSLKDENAEDDLKPLTRSFKLKFDLAQTGDFYFLDPFFLSSFKKNPFKDSVRTTDVDFGCNQSYAINMYITLPENISVADLPKNKEILLADSSISFGRLIVSENNAVIIRIHMELQNPIFTKDVYPFLKQVFEKIYALLNEQIVLKKKN